MTKNYKRWVEAVEVINTIVHDMLQKQVRLKKENPGLGSRKRFIDLLLESGSSYESVLSQMKTFIIAGFETIAAAISFALYELAKRPDIQEQMYREYKSIVGDNRDDTLVFDDVQRMTFTEQVIKETLRIYPPAPMMQRRLFAPVTIDGLTIPDGVDVIFSIPALHNLNFKDSTKFKPGRFGSENVDKPSPYAYAPFSIGPRDCIGQKISMIEMKFILSTIIKNFAVHAVQPVRKLKLITGGTLKSSNGVPVIFKKRT